MFWDAARGCWVGSVDIGRDPKTRKRRRRKVSAATKTECREKLDELRAERARTGTVAPRNITVETCIRSLLASPPAEWRSWKTIEANTVHAERLIRTIGKVRLVMLTPGHVRAVLDQMVSDGYATATISATKGLLAAAIRRAEQDGLVGRNVARLADTPRGTRRKSQSMTLAQIRALFASDLTTWWRAYLVTGILCGLRPGELLGLTWADVDFDAGVIRVRHCLKANRGPDGRFVLELEELKTARSKRTLAMPAKVAEVLRALKAAQAAARLRLGGYYDDRGIVFSGDAGQPKWQAVVNRQFKVICAKAGLGSDWHAHEQRHTFVSVLSDAGVDIEVIADAAGHINSTVTKTVYRHQIADVVAGATMTMDEIFGRVSGS